ncbi:cell wall hydrolase [Altererythrobacter indicus]|uniref:Cell wall hydrolase n=1 Tax=Altericroceibacterium indicum TaxID=374177 RepID=A0A845AAT1_9SPHN|nr:cell wall hydrolase [Altericroceibacterium indicum]MXP26459.1 cell wall hydrolase [Altericroceibacterium indicum]
MSRFNYKTAAIAAVIMLFITVFAVQGSGALAQNSASATNPSDEAGQTQDDAAQSDVRFVAQEVVQPLPQDAPDSSFAADAPTGEIALPEHSASTLRQLVSTVPTQANLSREMYCLAGAVYFEARGEPLDGQLAVAQVIVNRAESDEFPDDYCGVVTQRKQFSFVRGGHIPAVNRSSAAWKRAKAIAKIAHQELWESKASDALYFHAKYVRPRWANRKVTLATIDRHIFYR